MKLLFIYRNFTFAKFYFYLHSVKKRKKKNIFFSSSVSFVLKTNKIHSSDNITLLFFSDGAWKMMFLAVPVFKMIHAV